MATYIKNNLLFLFLWNVLLFNAVQGRVANLTQNQLVPANYWKDNNINDSNVAGDFNTKNLNNNDILGANAGQSSVGTLQNSGNDDVANPNERKDDVPLSQNLSEADILNEIRNILGLTQKSDNSIGITIVPASQENAPQNNTPVDNSIISTQPEETAPTSTALQVMAPTPTQNQDSSDSVGITILPVMENDSSKGIIPTENVQPAQEMAQAQNIVPTENDSVPNQQQLNNNNSDAVANSTTDQGGCGNVQNADSSSKLQLDQVTASQILYHLKVQYDQLNLKQGDSGETYEIVQKQKTFLEEMLLSEKTTSENNKNIVSTTYAAYYSAEYTYTFALCKLHHITKGFEDEQNPTHADISSKCSQIMETFKSFNISYKETISEVMVSGGDQVLKYDEDAAKAASTAGDNPNDSNTNSSNKKISTTNDETIQKQNLEKNLSGYNHDNFYNRARSEGNDVDQFDLKQSQQIGDSTYSNETKGKTSDTTSHLISEVREIPKNKSLDDPSNGAHRLRKMSDYLQIDSEADTRGRVENADFETDSDRLQQYNRTQKELDQLQTNYFDDDNKDVGGNIENAELQDVQSHYTAVTEIIRDVNEQVTKPKTHETDTSAKKYVFKQAVEKLTTFIQILHVFIDKMDDTVADKKKAGDKKGEDAYKEMHKDIYEETLVYRQYLKEYFSSTNVESGTFSDKNNLVAEEEETEILQTTTEERFSWLKNTDMQGQANSNSTTEDEMKSNPIILLWYFEEASFYSQHFTSTQMNVPFMSYLPYPNFNVKAVSNIQDGADIQFYLY